RENASPIVLMRPFLANPVTRESASKSRGEPRGVGVAIGHKRCVQTQEGPHGRVQEAPPGMSSGRSRSTRTSRYFLLRLRRLRCQPGLVEDGADGGATAGCVGTLAASPPIVRGIDHRAGAAVCARLVAEERVVGRGGDRRLTTGRLGDEEACREGLETVPGQT